MGRAKWRSLQARYTHEAPGVLCVLVVMYRSYTFQTAKIESLVDRTFVGRNPKDKLVRGALAMMKIAVFASTLNEWSARRRLGFKSGWSPHSFWFFCHVNDIFQASSPIVCGFRGAYYLVMIQWYCFSMAVFSFSLNGNYQFTHSFDVSSVNPTLIAGVTTNRP